MKMDNKGFTLVELIATIVILGIVVSIGSYSIIQLIQNSKQKDYDLLVKEIKEAAEVYYQECKYSKTDAITCTTSGSSYVVSLGDLVKYGYLGSNDSNIESEYVKNYTSIINPKDDKNISGCKISISGNKGKISISRAADSDSSCPEY